MNELKVTKEKVLEASKVSKEGKEVLQKLFPEVFEGDYFQKLTFGKNDIAKEKVRHHLNSISDWISYSLYDILGKYSRESGIERIEILSKILVEGIKKLK